MRKLVKYITTIITALFLTVALVACTKDVKVNLANANATVKVGKTVEVAFTLENAEKDVVVTVESSDTKIATATVSSSKVVITGVKEGSANITVKAGKASAVIKVTVSKAEVVVDPTQTGERIDFSETMTKKTTLKLWMDDADGAYATPLIEAFNELYPNIKVIFTHMGVTEAEDRLKVVGPTGGGADIFQFPHDHVSTCITSDLVLELPQNIVDLVKTNTHEIGIKTATAQYNAATGVYGPGSGAEAKMYGLPTSIESIGLFYNKDLLYDAIGSNDPADIPTTFEGLLQYAATWNNVEVAPGRTRLDEGEAFLLTSSHWADSYYMQPFYSAFGYYPFGANLDNKEQVGFTSNNVRQALQFFRNTLKPATTGNQGHDSSGSSKFEQGKSPFIIAGPWNHEAYRAKGLNYGVVKFPTIGGKEAKTYAGAIITGVYKYTTNQEDALKFIEFMNSEKAMQILFEYKHKLPAYKPDLLVNIPGVLDDPNFKVMSEQLETSVPMPTIPEVAYYWGPGETMIKNVWNDNSKVIDDEMEEAQKSYNALRGLTN
ncbi:MAG: extracellular solute-binding protein [Acholeplasmataceae bacterium]|jgi:arabinogalactan oligomer/maltooligosaccharide transport system substrate-binding protein